MSAESGTFKWFDGKKGYGFIKRDGGGKDVFVHATDLEASKYPGFPTRVPNDGDAISFDVESGRKGDRAVNIRPA